METTLQRKHDSIQDLHGWADWLLEKAPAKLKHDAQMYQACLLQLAQTFYNGNPGEAKRYTLQWANQCAQELAELAATGDPENSTAADIVTFETVHGDELHSACIGFYIADITIISRAPHRLVRTPRWVHTMMLEAVQWEKTLHFGTNSVANIQYKIGPAMPNLTDEEIVNAATLWEPAGTGPYTTFADAIGAIKLLA